MSRDRFEALMNVALGLFLAVLLGAVVYLATIGETSNRREWEQQAPERARRCRSSCAEAGLGVAEWCPSCACRCGGKP